MSTKNCSATIYLTNNTGGNALIQMSHKNEALLPESGCWFAKSGEKVGPLFVHFQTDSGSTSSEDHWYCSASVQDGPNAGIYATGGKLLAPTKGCDLKSEDDGGTFTNTISPTSFKVNLKSGSSDTSVAKLASYPTSGVSNVFVFMLENHSFDHLLGFCGFDGVDGLSGNESNVYNGTTYTVNKGADDPMPIGPGHEFMDTMKQLCGPDVVNPFPSGGKSYPSIDNSGFVGSYAEEGAGSSATGDVMDCCSSHNQVPVLWNLANSFAVCDQWYSSMPGPTWPNRLFAMGGSSAGLDDSPSSSQVVGWEIFDGFKYANGSIFDQLKKSKVSYRLYNDFGNDYSESQDDDTGSFAIVSGLENIHITDVHKFSGFSDAVNQQYPYTYTWIEPNYGDGDDFSGGSSQHPVDSLMGGEKMLGALYNAIRTSPYWATSLLIVTYDEHGGFYDHVSPPTAIKPGDAVGEGLNTNGFNFSQYGIRVPAVIVSPKIPGGTVSHTLYDHTSILKTVESLYSVPSLTKRDAGANDVTKLLSLANPRADTIPQFQINTSGGSTTSNTTRPNPDIEMAVTPLPRTGNIHGFLRIAAKADYELSDGSEATKAAIRARLQTIQTKGQAKDYIREVLGKVKAAKDAEQSIPAAQ